MFEYWKEPTDIRIWVNGKKKLKIVSEVFSISWSFPTLTLRSFLKRNMAYLQILLWGHCLDVRFALNLASYVLHHSFEFFYWVILSLVCGFLVIFQLGVKFFNLWSNANNSAGNVNFLRKFQLGSTSFDEFICQIWL